MIAGILVLAGCKSSKQEKPQRPNIIIILADDLSYGELVADLDYHVGLVVNKLKEEGLFNNSLIIFTSDNGSHVSIRDPGMDYFEGTGDVIHEFGHLANGNLKGFKGDIWEGGHRVPLIINWPEKIEPGLINPNLVSLTNISPTLADLLMDKSADSLALDGISLLPTLIDPVTSTRNIMVQHSASGKFAIRQGNWKLITVHDGGSPYSSSYMKKYDSIHWITTDEMQLYDIQKDTREQYNLIRQYPVKAKEMLELLEYEKMKFMVE